MRTSLRHDSATDDGMVIREASDGYILIAQTAHAWIAGQLAQAWGNATFGELSPRRDVCLAAELHDIGWLDWELAPTWNPTTGRPYTFLDLPRREHIAIWSKAAHWLRPQSAYAALLTSLHGTGLYSRYDGAADTEEEKAIVRAFLMRQRALQTSIREELRADPQWAPYSSDEAIERNRRLIAVWDWISLLLCFRVTRERAINDVPTRCDRTTLRLTPVAADEETVVVSPWPFRCEEVVVACDGRFLTTTFETEAAMRAAIEAAPRVHLRIRLVRRG